MGQSRARYLFTDRGEGDLAVESVGVDERRRSVVDLPWTWLRQVHGSDVVVVERPGEHAGMRADAAVTAESGAALAVQSADCAPVAIMGEDTVGVAHAGWRGLVAGVVPALVEASCRLNPPRLREPQGLRAVVGPCIRPCCYEFDADDLDVVAGVTGESVRSRTASGRPALDLVSGIRAALASAGVERCDDVGVCTGCSPRHWSHRTEAAVERQAVVAWLEP